MAFAPGNQLAVGKATGRPPLFETAEDLQIAIDGYFNNGIKKRKFVVGSGKNQTEIEVEIPTITGLCYHIGFESRQSFYRLEKNDVFSYTVKRARLFIEMEYEEQLQYGNTTGAIFALKNMGWIDKQEVEHSGTAINVTVENKKAGDGLSYILGDEANEKAE